MSTVQAEELVLRVTLPWPDRDLSPNSRLHWAVKAKAVKAAREAAGWAVRRTFRAKPDWTRVAVSFEFCPPDARRRDLDNVISCMKAVNDGIADAIGIDDSKFIPTYRMSDPVKDGAVHITIRGAE